ncbi:hypothetical protein EVAR_218_1 [Eumeta japonica]|uniref:Peripherin-2 n=1 Tax=Eumeta variegata TaxID=151549 RepID=A0A4C1S977_EUMVA|nr:hypothetical protein EVAR_218_1 [Eumeta japonica]
MACCAVELGAAGRGACATALRSALIAQLVLSLCLVIFCYNASIHVLTLLKDVHRVTILFVYGLILLHAYSMKLHYTSGLRLTSILTQYPYWPRIDPLCRTWTVLGSLIAINGLFVSSACHLTLKALMKDLSVSLRVGIAQYLTEPTWKRLLDTMQVELRCCGVDKPSDWHEIPWITMDFLNQDSELVMSSRALGLADKRGSGRQWTWREVWAERAALAAASLHANGCADAVQEPLRRAVFALKCFNVIVFILQMIIIVLARMLRTSARSAVLRGDRLGPGLGYLFGNTEKQIQKVQYTAEEGGGDAFVPHPTHVYRLIKEHSIHFMTRCAPVTSSAEPRPTYLNSRFVANIQKDNFYIARNVRRRTRRAV